MGGRWRGSPPRAWAGWGSPRAARGRAADQRAQAARAEHAVRVRVQQQRAAAEAPADDAGRACVVRQIKKGGWLVVSWEDEPGRAFAPALAAAFEAQLDHPEWGRDELLKVAVGSI